MPIKTSTVLALVVGASLLAGQVHAQGANRVKIGAWTATDFAEAMNPGCSIGVDSSVAGGRMILGVSRKQSDPLSLVFRNPSWTIRAGTPVTIMAIFDQTEMQVTGTGAGNAITVELSGDQLKDWTHLLTAGAILRVSFIGGTSPVWLFDLTGSSTAVNTMGQCIKTHQLVGVGFPFSQAFAPALSTPRFVAAPSTPAFTPAYEPGSPLVPESARPAPPIYAAQPTVTPERSAPAISGTPALPAPGKDPVLSTWSGTSNMQTRPFHVDGPWELQWANGEGYFSINLHGGSDQNGKLIANGSDAGTSSYYSPSSGDFYLEIKGRSGWQIRAVSVASTTPQQVVSAAPAYIPPPTPAPAPTPARFASPSTTSNASGGEAGFVDVALQGRQRFNAAPSEFAQGATRPDRKDALCRAYPSSLVNGWTGKLVTLSTNGDGKGVVAVEIAPHVQLKTWNNALSDIGSKTLIGSDSPVYRSLGTLRVGQMVRFSGRLFSSETDCYKETSMTISGSMTDPEFLFQFETIEGM